MLKKNLNILIGVTGSIAAYKVPELIRAWRAIGASVRVVLTRSAEDFVAPLCLEALSESKIYRSQDHLDVASKMCHIELAHWADHLLIAPASAHCIAKLAHGLCDDLLSTLCLVSQAPLWVAPAMNRLMWEATATQANVSLLKSRSARFLGPDEGPQACGDIGPGRMLEATAIVASITEHLQSPIWKGKKIVITGGPTREAIDPIRYISNHSTGHMAYALARCAYSRGANVVLITGPTHLAIPAGVQAIHVNTAAEMLAASLEQAKGADLFIAAAAVSDYEPRQVCVEKIKKSSMEWQLDLKPTPDIIATVAHLPQRPKCVIGFAAETENLEQNAQQKLNLKNLDAIVANTVGTSLGFGNVLHEAIWISRKQPSVRFPKTEKAALAEAILKEIEKLI